MSIVQEIVYPIILCLSIIAFIIRILLYVFEEEIEKGEV
jgi:hypothetical protein